MNNYERRYAFLHSRFTGKQAHVVSLRSGFRPEDQGNLVYCPLPEYDIAIYYFEDKPDGTDQPTENHQA